MNLNGKNSKANLTNNLVNMVNKERLLETFLKIVKIKSPSKDEKEVVDFVERELSSLGLKVYRDNCGKKFGSNAGNLVATYNENILPQKEPVFLGAHLDTVCVKGEIIPTIKNGKILNNDRKSILGADDKVAVASILECLRIIRENNIPTREIDIVFTISEETGLLGAKNLDLGKIKAEIGFVFDGSGNIGTIITRAPYQNSIYADFEGKAAHAGVCPEKGINSVYAASVGISNIKWGRVDEETTCNVGIIEGGVARNIVPQNTKVEAEARSIKLSKLEEITAIITSSFEKAAFSSGVKLKYKVVREYDGFEISESDICVRIAKRAIEKLGIKPKIKSSGGGSDVNIFNARGKKAVNLSSGMENAHTNKEYVKIEELIKLPALMLSIIQS